MHPALRAAARSDQERAARAFGAAAAATADSSFGTRMSAEDAAARLEAALSSCRRYEALPEMERQLLLALLQASALP